MMSHKWDGMEVNILVDKTRLMGRIVGAGYTQRSLAQAMKVSKNTLNSKINNRIPFDTDDIQILCDLVGITNGKEKAEIFLAKPSHMWDERDKPKEVV